MSWPENELCAGIHNTEERFGNNPQIWQIEYRENGGDIFLSVFHHRG